MPNRISCVLCTDCVTLEESDDTSSFDYCYNKREAAARIKECSAGLDSLHAQGEFFDDSFDEDDEVWMRCGECSHIHRRSDIVFILDQDGDEDDDEVSVCPSCKELDSMSTRGGGRDEFSYEDCDACGSSLGGARTRYALFPFFVEGGSVVPEQMALAFE